MTKQPEVLRLLSLHPSVPESSVGKPVEITKVQVRLKENLEAIEKIFKPEYLLPCSLMETLQRTGWEPSLIDSLILLGSAIPESLH